MREESVFGVAIVFPLIKLYKTDDPFNAQYQRRSVSASQRQVQRKGGTDFHSAGPCLPQVKRVLV